MSETRIWRIWCHPRRSRLLRPLRQVKTHRRIAEDHLPSPGVVVGRPHAGQLVGIGRAETPAVGRRASLKIPRTRHFGHATWVSVAASATSGAATSGASHFGRVL